LDFGARLKEILIFKGITQEQLAYRTGKGAPHISKLVNGKMQPLKETIEEISKAIDINPAIFYTMDCDSETEQAKGVIKRAVEAEPSPLNFWPEIQGRPSQAVLIRQMAHFSEDTIRTILTVGRALEQEDNGG